VTNKLPKHLRGPFVNAIYDKRKATIYLKKTNGEWTSTLAYPSFFVHAKDIKEFPFDEFGSYIINKQQDGTYFRLTRDPEMDREDLREMIYTCEDMGVKLFEADVSPIRRWFSDTGSLVEKKFKNLYFDLEADPLKIGFDDDALKMHRIISFAAYDDDGNSWFYAAKESSNKEEKILIKKFLKLAQDYDVLLAWNGDSYDFKVLYNRCKKHKIKVDWRNWNLLDHMRVVKKVLMSIADSDFKRSFALDSIGENVLGIRKIKLSVPPGQMKLLLTPDRVGELEKYNRRDVEIMRQIEQRKEYLELHYMVCSMCRSFPNRGSIYPNELADGILLRMAVEEGRHFPSRLYKDRDENKQKYEGAYVMDPKVGFHQNVQVPDFASLYPSIILSWNMSNETVLNETDDYSDFNGDYAKAPTTGVCFRTDYEGMIPKALSRLIKKRGEYKFRAKQYEVGTEEYKNMTNLSTAVKVVTNSFYGLIGNEGSRFYNKDIARSVTLTGQWLIRQTADYFDQHGYETVYGDTDSVFCIASQEDMMQMIDDLNSQFFPRLLKNVGCKSNHIKLDFDKGFATLLLITKKRYVGKLSLMKGRQVSSDVEPEVKGLETQRSDQVRYAQELLRKYMDILIQVEADPVSVDQLLRDDADLFFKKELSVDEIEIAASVKDYPDKYKVKNPQVKVAEQMINDGMEFFPGMKIPYVVVGHKPSVQAIHSSLYDGHCDRNYYWENRILPPITRLLNVRFPDYPFNSFVNPGQIIFDFSTQPKKIKKTKMVQRKVRKPKVKKVRKIKKTAAQITIPNSERDEIISIIANLVQLYPGNLTLKIIIELDDCDVVIRTNEKVSIEGLQYIDKQFPQLKVSPT
jgi:DNA polymerase I